MGAYKFRVLLDSEKNEEIFRDIIVSKTDNFESFYRTILFAFDFKNEEMASFYMSNEDWDKGHEITLMDMTFGEEASETAIMSDTTIENEIAEPNQKIILVHDFLKMWIFLIELQEELQENVEHPYVHLSIGKSPDENEKSDDFMMESDFEEDEDEYFDGFESLDEDDLEEGFENYDEFEY